MEALYTFLIPISLLTLIASTVGTMTGFGTSTIMIPILVMFLQPLEVLILVSIIHWFGDLWKILLFRKGINGKLIALFGITGFFTSYLGASLSVAIEKVVFLRAFGGFMVLYSSFLMYQSSFKITANNNLAVLGGGLSGFFTGMFGIGGAIRGMFLSAFNLPKEVYIATAGAIGLIIDTTRIITYFSSPVSLPNYLWWSLCILIPVSYLGAHIAQYVIATISQKKFRTLVTIFLLFMGIKLILWP